MADPLHKNTPLHGVKLKTIVAYLHEKFGWDGLSDRIDVNCFKKDPSIISTVKFLRKQEWAKEEIEKLYVETITRADPWVNSRKSE